MPGKTIALMLFFTLIWSVLMIEPVTAAEPMVEFIPFTAGLSGPTAIENAGDVRLFVTEKQGRIQIVRNDGSIDPVPFLDITDRVLSSGGEQGLLGLAFHPLYPSNGYFYVNYTDLNGDTVVSRFTISPDPDLADPASEQILLGFAQPYSNHNGGDLAFGPDGYLYISTGDGGSGGDPQNYAQNPLTLLGKILRIDVDAGSPYGIPADNPFVSDPGVLDEIWALGLRNPWRFAFDSVTGDFWIADVGQSVSEEINFQPAASSGGENYGWRCYEGTFPYNTTGCNPPENYVFPVFEFLHPDHCSVTGGVVYRGTNYPELDGHYFFTDYCSGNLWSLSPDGQGGWTVHDYGMFSSFISSFGIDFNGEIYAVSLSDGMLYRLESTNTVIPSLSYSGIALLLITLPFIIRRRR